ncbi:O-antigen ligase family protein [Caldibacillus debilis]|uniref:O-antigen ligase family protein n=1 Tax=Caldibacillus debilis TaxID=301148 RepID=UPI0009DB19FA|nr:O-antigen ligase family protein [Caldibacillus debilis]
MNKISGDSMQIVKKYAFVMQIVFLLGSLVFQRDWAGYGLSAAIFLLAFLNRKAGFYFLCVYFSVRPFVIELNPGMKFAGDLAILALFFPLFYQKGWGRNADCRRYRFIGYFLSFSFIGSLAAFLSGVDIFALFFQWRAYWITLLLVFIGAEMKWTKKEIANLLLLTVGMADLLAVCGLIEKISWRTLLLPESWQNWQLSGTNRIRIYGLLANPNVLAGYFVIAFVSAIALLRRNPSAKSRWFFMGSAALIFGAFLLTYSRGTMIAFLLAAVFYYAAKREFSAAKPILLSVLSAVLLVYLPAVALADMVGKNFMEGNGSFREMPVGEGGKRYSDLLSGEMIEESAQWGRIYIVKKGLEIFMDHPWIGTGFATFGDSATLVRSSPIYEKYRLSEGIYTDNQYIQIVVQSGLAGTACFSLFVFGMLRAVRRYAGEREARLLFYAFFAMAAIGSAFYNMLEDKIFTLYFYSFLGYLLNRRKTGFPERREAKGSGIG